MIYFDPSLTNSLGDILRSAFLSKGSELPEGMTRGDLIMASHHHLDHVDGALIERLTGKDTTILGPERCRKKLGASMKAVSAGQDLTFDDLKVEVVEAYNPPGSRSIAFHKKGECVAYILTADGKRIYHAGDTGLTEEMGSFGPVDVALLPIGGKFTMDIDEAVEAVKIIKPAVVVPMHMLKADPQLFKELVERETASRAKVLSPGEMFGI